MCGPDPKVTWLILGRVPHPAGTSSSVRLRVGGRVYLQPAWDSVWNPGWQRSHLSPITPGLQLQRPELSHCVLREPRERQNNVRTLGTAATETDH